MPISICYDGSGSCYGMIRCTKGICNQSIASRLKNQIESPVHGIHARYSTIQDTGERLTQIDHQFEGTSECAHFILSQIKRNWLHTVLVLFMRFFVRNEREWIIIDSIIRVQVLQKEGSNLTESNNYGVKVVDWVGSMMMVNAMIFSTQNFIWNRYPYQTAITRF